MFRVIVATKEETEVISEFEKWSDYKSKLPLNWGSKTISTPEIFVQN
jgi:hypothetical protein